jgi:hypothetical protein
VHKPEERLAGRKKVTQACVDAKFAEVERALEQAPRPTAKQRRAAAEACFSESGSFVAEPELRDEIPQWGVAGILSGVTVLAIVLMILVAGCVPAEALTHLENRHAGMVGVTKREVLPIEARVVAYSAARGFSAQHVILGGDPLPMGEVPVEVQEAFAATLAQAEAATVTSETPR